MDTLSQLVFEDMAVQATPEQPEPGVMVKLDVVRG
jgi:hypothetical protein